MEKFDPAGKVLESLWRHGLISRPKAPHGARTGDAAPHPFAAGQESNTVWFGRAAGHPRSHACLDDIRAFVGRGIRNKVFDLDPRGI